MIYGGEPLKGTQVVRLKRDLRTLEKFQLDADPVQYRFAQILADKLPDKEVSAYEFVKFFFDELDAVETGAYETGEEKVISAAQSYPIAEFFIPQFSRVLPRNLAQDVIDNWIWLRQLKLEARIAALERANQ